MAYKQFEITGKCNLGCEVCYNKELMKYFKNIEVGAVLQNVSRGDVVYLGGGEPMLHKNIEEIVQGIIDIGAEVVISTNGTIYKKIPKEAQIQVSLWTLEPNLYKKILNGTGRQLENVLNNVKRYISDGNTLFINMPVYEANLSEIKSVSDYADSLGVPLRINPIFPANGFSNSPDLEKKIENSVLALRLKGRNIIYHRNKQPVERFYKC
ncbi:MAG: radical SAM protein [Candidatus Pacearchaeota archaeon]